MILSSFKSRPHFRSYVGSLSLKRVLNETYGGRVACEGRPWLVSQGDVKRRRLEEEPELEAERLKVLERWHLVHDPAVRYVVQTAELEDVIEVGKSDWRPAAKGLQRNGRDPKSAAEQVNERLLETRERKLIAKDMVTVIEAWRMRWGLRKEDVQALNEAGHKDLRRSTAAPLVS